MYTKIFDSKNLWFFRTRQPPRRMMPQQIPISAPLKPQRYSASVSSPSSGQIHEKYDIVVWIEICELAPSGEYIPVTVNHSDETPCQGTFQLHQGIQRRIRITLIHEKDPDVVWKEIRELVVGRVRSDPEIDEGFDDEEDESILSLSLFSGEYLTPVGSRSVFRFEAAWDTSLHNSCLLNRVTAGGEHVFLTLSAYVDVSKHSQAKHFFHFCSNVADGKVHSTSSHHKRSLSRDSWKRFANLPDGFTCQVFEGNDSRCLPK